MKRYLFLLLSPLLLHAESLLEFSGYLGAEYKYYNNNNRIPVIDAFGRTAIISDKENKRTSNSAAYTGMEFAYKDENLNARAQIEFFDDSDESARDHYRINELYVGYSSENSDFTTGKRIFFLGSIRSI